MTGLSFQKRKKTGLLSSLNKRQSVNIHIFSNFPSKKKTGVLSALALNKRQYVTATAMQPEIAILMANLAGVAWKNRVLDPFCGSCSILLACSHLVRGTCAHSCTHTCTHSARTQSHTRVHTHVHTARAHTRAHTQRHT